MQYTIEPTVIMMMIMHSWKRKVSHSWVLQRYNAMTLSYVHYQTFTSLCRQISYYTFLCICFTQMLTHEQRMIIFMSFKVMEAMQDFLCSFLQPQIRDKLTSLEAELRSSMRESRYYERRELPPVIDVTTSSVEKESISIQKNCGSDNICVPNLVVKVNQ